MTSRLSGIAFQRVDAKADGKNTLHLDLHVDEQAEVLDVVQQATQLGAEVLEHHVEEDVDRYVLADSRATAYASSRRAERR
jgi:hypothetical protein